MMLKASKQAIKVIWLLSFLRLTHRLKGQYVSMKAVQSCIISLPVNHYYYVHLQEFTRH